MLNSLLVPCSNSLPDTTLSVQLPLGPEASAPAAAQQATPGQEASYLQPTNDAEPVQQQRHCDQNQWRTRAVQFAEPASELSPQNTRRLADHCRRHRVHRAVVAPKPSGAWRAGEASGFPSPPRTGASCTRALGEGQQGPQPCATILSEGTHVPCVCHCPDENATPCKMQENDHIAT